MPRRLAHFSDPRLDAQIGELIKHSNATRDAADSHASRRDNPHKVTAEQVGAPSAEEVQAKVDTHAAATTGVHGVGASEVESKAGAQAKVDAHAGRTDNPHAVTAAQVGAAPASDNAGFHNSIYRGKFLGNEVTSEQWDRIADGTFRDMYIGDYWTINGTTYLIAAFNYYYNTGDTALTANHITLVPAGTLYNHRMNPTSTTEGGYAGSEMHTTGLDQAKTKIHTDFAGHVVNHRKYLSNAVSNGQASASALFDSDVELMNEMMICGSVVNGKGTFGYYNIGIEKSQLPLFSLRPDLLNIRTTWWLRDVCSATSFAYVNVHGHVIVASASYSAGVRPVFSISA
jgi:hypothetical protein